MNWHTFINTHVGFDCQQMLQEPWHRPLRGTLNGGWDLSTQEVTNTPNHSVCCIKHTVISSYYKNNNFFVYFFVLLISGWTFPVIEETLDISFLKMRIKFFDHRSFLLIVVDCLIVIGKIYLHTRSDLAMWQFTSIQYEAKTIPGLSNWSTDRT